MAIRDYERLRETIVKSNRKWPLLQWLISEYPNPKEFNAVVMSRHTRLEVSLMSQWAREYEEAKLSLVANAGWHILVPDIGEIIGDIETRLGIHAEELPQRNIVSFPSSNNSLGGDSTGTIRQMRDPRPKNRRSW